jgi:hypothetical protein
MTSRLEQRRLNVADWDDRSGFYSGMEVHLKKDLWKK